MSDIGRIEELEKQLAEAREELNYWHRMAEGLTSVKLKQLLALCGKEKKELEAENKQLKKENDIFKEMYENTEDDIDLMTEVENQSAEDYRKHGE